LFYSVANGGATEDCWKNEIERLLVEDNSKVLERARICISHYAEDKNFDPPQGLSNCGIDFVYCDATNKLLYYRFTRAFQNFVQK